METVRPFEFMVSWRYLKSKRHQTFISLITWISVGGVALGVMALIVVLGVMGGFEKNLREKILGATAHVVLVRHDSRAIDEAAKLLDTVRRVPGVVGAAPFVVSQVLLTSERNVTGAVLRGVQARSLGSVMNLERSMRQGSLFSLDGAPGGAPPPKHEAILIGRELARTLHITLGDAVKVVSPVGELTPSGYVPKSQTFQVGGIFETGLFEYDNGLAYIGLRSAQRFFDLDELISGIEVRVNDLFAAGPVARRIRAAVGFPFITKDWMQMNRNLFAALRLERLVMFIILVMIVLVAAFNIVSTLIMVVMEKRRDIAILKSMGASNRSIIRIFVLQGLFIGAVGTVVGSISGYIIGWTLQTYHYIRLPAEVYLLETLPFDLQVLMFGCVIVATMLLAFGATLYPAWSATRIQPVDVLRYG